MDDQQAAVTTPAREGLKRNSLNLPRLAFIGLAYFSLAPVIYLNMGFMETDSGGPVMPFLFILITIAVLPTAISYALLNNAGPRPAPGTRGCGNRRTRASGGSRERLRRPAPDRRRLIREDLPCCGQ